MTLIQPLFTDEPNLKSEVNLLVTHERYSLDKKEEKHFFRGPQRVLECRHQ